jgi:hypothetical protein
MQGNAGEMQGNAGKCRGNAGEMQGNAGEMQGKSILRFSGPGAEPFRFHAQDTLETGCGAFGSPWVAAGKCGEIILRFSGPMPE